MTKKHFNAIAEALLFVRPTTTKRSKQWQQWQRDVKAMADVCAASNGRFDRQRFYFACGLDSEQ